MPLAHLLGQSGPSPSVVLTLPVDDIWSLDQASFLESFRATVTMLPAEADLQITEQDLDRRQFAFWHDVGTIQDYVLRRRDLLGRH